MTAVMVDAGAGVSYLASVEDAAVACSAVRSNSAYACSTGVLHSSADPFEGTCVIEWRPEIGSGWRVTVPVGQVRARTRGLRLR